jgi:hypothetical protein
MAPDDWLMDDEIEISHGSGPPPGAYACTFDGIQPSKADDPNLEKYGPSWKFVWTVADGPHKGIQATRITGTKPTAGNACGKLLAGLAGGAVAGGQRMRWRDAIGKKFLVVVEPTASGKGTRVTSCVPLT